MPIYAESHVQAVNWQIYLKSDSGKGGYLSARSGGNIIFSDWAEPSEVITLIDINGGDLISRDLVHLKSIHRRFFTADPDTKKVLADQLQARERETFRIIKQNGSGTIRNGDMISLLSNHNEYLGTHPHSTRNGIHARTMVWVDK